MRRVPVQSSVLASVGYAPRAKVLEVEFRTGFVYQYYDVPKRVFDALMASQSRGAYFNRHVRDRYRFDEVGARTKYEEFR